LALRLVSVDSPERCGKTCSASEPERGERMPNPGQPTIREGDTGDAVRRLQRAIRRLPGPDLVVDGIFGHETRRAVREFQQANGLSVDGVVGPATWHALPDGGPMPVLAEGSDGHVVRNLQTVLHDGVSNWGTGPGPRDGQFGPRTRASVEAFQRWGRVSADGVVGDRTWAVNLGALSATLETEVGLEFVVG
jgi:peptidoglycan hydrolase-like protein with peptidoglycan-binding domain